MAFLPYPQAKQFAALPLATPYHQRYRKAVLYPGAQPSIEAAAAQPKTKAKSAGKLLNAFARETWRAAVRLNKAEVDCYCAVARNPAGKQIWPTVRSTELLTIAEAHIRAREIIPVCATAYQPSRQRAETFAAVAANWLKSTLRPRRCAQAAA